MTCRAQYDQTPLEGAPRSGVSGQLRFPTGGHLVGVYVAANSHGV